MKTLTAALEAAQRANSAIPYVRARFADYDGYARRGRFTRHYSGAEQHGAIAAALAPDGSLVRLRRELNVATVQVQVAASSDDANEDTGTVDLIESGPGVNIDNTNEWLGFRFLGVTVPQGAPILRARLHLVVTDTGDEPDHIIHGQDADNAGTFTTGASDLSGRTRTTANVGWDSADLGGDGETFIESPDVSAIVQEIVDRGGWASGNAMVFLIQGSADSARDLTVAQYDRSSGEYAAKLEIVYGLDTPAAEIFVSRVATPAPGSTWSSWSSLDDEVSYLGGVALCADSDTLYAFVVDDDLTTLKVYTSGNNGASWSGPTTVSSAGGTKTHIAAAAADDDDIVVFWAETDGIVYRSRWNGSAWGARTAWTLSVSEVHGLAASYLLDWQVVVAGVEATTLHPKLWGCRYGDGANLTINTWSALREISAAAFGSDVSFAAPSLAWEDDAFRLWFVERYAGDAAYDRLQWSTMGLLHDLNEEQWREPVAFDFEGEYGAAVVISATRMWLAAADGVWSSLLPANAELDASASILEATVRVDAGGTLVELELDSIVWGEELVTRGARLQLTPGYRTSIDDLPATPFGYWVESVELVTGERPHVLVTARDGWWLLDRWRARRQMTWAAGEKAVSQILLVLVARAGVEFFVEASSDALTALTPAFTVHPGESGATAVRRLLSLVEDVGRWDGADFTTNHTADDDAATYSLGGDGEHAVLEAAHRGLQLEVNRARVVGLEVYGEAADYADIEASGERIGQVIDVNLVRSDECADRAAAVLRISRLNGELAELSLFGVHCGVELWDVVELTEDQGGLAAEPLRVNAYQWRYAPRRGRYDMQLTLGPV